MPVSDRPVRASKEELELLQKIDAYLKEHREASLFDATESAHAPAILVGEGDHKTLEIPALLFEVIREAVDILLEGGAVAIMPYHAQLTTQEAANYLQVSRPHLISLLDEEKIPYRRLRSHRRILLRDLESYRQRRDDERKQALDELSREVYEAGFYTMMEEKTEPNE